MNTMTYEELEALIKGEGFICIPRLRRSGKKYFYASRRVGPKMKEVYIAPESHLETLSESVVRGKLAKISQLIDKK